MNNDSQNLAGLIDEAFEYRGYVTLSRRDGSKLIGFVYDRTPSHVELFDELATNRIKVPLDDIVGIELTGEDTAAKAQQIWERRMGSLDPSDTSRWGDWEEHSVLILVALPNELRAVAKVLGAKPRGNLARGRLGDLNATVIAVGMGGGAAHAIEAERPKLVISCGLAGGLDPKLVPGDVVLASSVRDEVGDTLAADERVLRAARAALQADGAGKLAEGELLCATEVAATADDKRALAAPGRLAIDLESWAAANAAEKAGIPWLAFRVVIDPVDASLPAFTREAHTSYVVPALRHALRGPSAIKELLQLGQQARTAGHSLERALRRIAPILGGLMQHSEARS